MIDVAATAIRDVKLITPRRFGDARGWFSETWTQPKMAAEGLDYAFMQDNHSYSSRGTLRGLHGQSPHAQGKLVRVIEGEIFDVAVDVRRGSPAYGRFLTVELSSENHRQIYVPPGLVHGFVVTSEVAQVEYKCTDFYHPECEFSVAWNDPALGIRWPVEKPILSPKDAAAPVLAEVQDRLIDFAE